MSKGTIIHDGQLQVSRVMSQDMMTIPLETPLKRVAELLSQGGTQHLLVTDQAGNLVGVVTERDLLRNLLKWQESGTAELEGRTVESVMSSRFVCGSPDASADDVATLTVDQSIQCLPILEDGRLVGVLTSNDLLLSWNRLEPVVKQAGTDGLTGLANRTTFDRRLAEEFDRARRLLTPLSLLLFDVDRFKEINDQCGHQAGDAVLRMFGVCLTRHLRKYDVAARIGGDEFAVICSGCGPDEIISPIERLRRAVRCLSFPLGTERSPVSVSIGVAVLQSGFDDVQPYRLIQAADQCLYRAKRSGRDRIWGVLLEAGDLSADLSFEPEPALS